jgi:hypothetical protein
MQRWATLCRDARPLEAARRVRRRIVRIAGGARSRDGISPPATACAEAVRASQAQVTHSRSADLHLAVPAVPVAARSCGHLPARDADTLASEWLPPVLALEVRRRAGRPAIPAEIRNLVRAISRDNPLWGAPRIHGELLKLGIDIAQSTVAKYMPRRHRPPSPAGGSSCAVTLPTSQPLICSSFRPSGSSFCTGWSSCVWSGDGSSGPM